MGLLELLSVWQPLTCLLMMIVFCDDYFFSNATEDRKEISSKLQFITNRIEKRIQMLVKKKYVDEKEN